MDNLIFLSHEIKQNMPSYGDNNFKIKFIQMKSLKRGDSCNKFSFRAESHLGTHVDAPAHFFDKGKKVIDYPPGYWHFAKPFLLELSLKENQVVEINDIKRIPPQADILLIKSSFQRFRGKIKYSFNNPGISPSVAIWLRKKHPKIRALGIDFISVSPYQDRALGRECHRAFLDPKGENEPILILEDLNLAKVNRRLAYVWVSPLRVEFFDSAPCTVMGRIGV